MTAYEDLERQRLLDGAAKLDTYRRGRLVEYVSATADLIEAEREMKQAVERLEYWRSRHEREMRIHAEKRAAMAKAFGFSEAEPAAEESEAAT